MGRVSQPEAIRTALAKKLKVLLEERHPGRGGSRKVAEDIGVRPQQWSQWAAGNSFPLKEQREKIAAYFGIDEAELSPESLEKMNEQMRDRRNQAPMVRGVSDVAQIATILSNMQIRAMNGEMPPERFAAVAAEILKFVHYALYEVKNDLDMPPSESPFSQSRIVLRRK